MNVNVEMTNRELKVAVQALLYWETMLSDDHVGNDWRGDLAALRALMNRLHDTSTASGEGE